MEDLSKQWIDDVKNVVREYNVTVVEFTVALTCGLVVFYLIFGELFIVRNLNRQYDMMRKVYENFMPDYLIAKEKIIKAELVQKGILHK